MKINDNLPYFQGLSPQELPLHWFRLSEMPQNTSLRDDAGYYQVEPLNGKISLALTTYKPISRLFDTNIEDFTETDIINL